MSSREEEERVRGTVSFWLPRFGDGQQEVKVKLTINLAIFTVLVQFAMHKLSWQ